MIGNMCILCVNGEPKRNLAPIYSSTRMSSRRAPPYGPLINPEAYHMSRIQYTVNQRRQAHQLLEDLYTDVIETYAPDVPGLTREEIERELWSQEAVLQTLLRFVWCFENNVHPPKHRKAIYMEAKQRIVDALPRVHLARERQLRAFEQQQRHNAMRAQTERIKACWALGLDPRIEGDLEKVPPYLTCEGCGRHLPEAEFADRADRRLCCRTCSKENRPLQPLPLAVRLRHSSSGHAREPRFPYSCHPTWRKGGVNLDAHIALGVTFCNIVQHGATTKPQNRSHVCAGRRYYVLSNHRSRYPCRTRPVDIVALEECR